MTPRTVRGTPNVDFARQVALQRREQQQQQQQQPNKRFRSSAAPKGTKLAAGYRDRAQDRLRDAKAVDDDVGADGTGRHGQENNGGGDDRARRVLALEESMKLGQIDRATFERLRDDITGGDIRATHLVKGLDRRLLERVRRGEDVLSGDGSGNADGKGHKNTDADATADEDNGSSQDNIPANIEEEFAQLEQKEVVPMAREKTVKKGIMAPPPPPSIAGAKRSRNAILAQLKASRQSQAQYESQAPVSATDSGSEDRAVAQPQLGSKFRRIGEKQQTSRIERDERGREVLVIRDRNGKVIKRKVRKVESRGQGHTNRQNGTGKSGGVERDSRDEKGLLMPTNTAQPLGVEVSDLVSAASAAAAAKKAAMGADGNEEEGDIFEGIGTEYDPLGSDSSDDNKNNEDAGGGGTDEAKTNGQKESLVDKDANAEKHSSKNKDKDKDKNNTDRPPTSSRQQPSASPSPSQPQSIRPRNYFTTSTTADTKTTTSTSTSKNANTTADTNPLADPTLLSALKKASAIHKASNTSSHEPPSSRSLSDTSTPGSNPLHPVDPSDPSDPIHPDRAGEDDEGDQRSRLRLRDRLQARARASDRDLEDLDLGFGSSRFGDAEDMELDVDGARGGRGLGKLAEWGGGGDADEDCEDGGDGGDGGVRGGVGGKKGKGSRKGKKRRGDKNSVGDVLGVVERLRGERAEGKGRGNGGGGGGGGRSGI